MVKPTRKSNLTKIILLSLCVCALYFPLSATGIFDIPKLKTNDLFFSLAYKIKKPPSQINQITLVIIDEESYNKLGQRWPWKRDIFALFLQKLKNYHPKLVCLDFIFGGEATPQEDRLLAEAIREAENIFLISYFSPTGEYITPQRIFSESVKAVGFMDKLRDKDNVMRRSPLVHIGRTLEGELKVSESSLELKVIANYLDIPFENIHLDNQGQGILLKAQDKGIRIPLREDMSVLINYSASMDQFRTISFWKVIKEEISKEEIENKIVIVGLTGEIFHDIHPTPLGLMPGVVVLANNILMLLSGNFIREFTPLGNLLVFALFCLATGIATHKLYLLKGLAFVSLEIIGLGLVGIGLNSQNWQWDSFSPIFLVTVTYGTVSLYEYLCLLKEAASLQTLAITDGLTGLFLHRYFQVRLQYEFGRVQRYAGELSLAILDLDHFKDFNDTYGHEAGNLALKAVAETMRNLSRKIDILARYGGEEFCVILPQTKLEGAINYAEKLRREIEKLEVFISLNKKAKITVSIGIASYLADKIGSPEELIKCADKALYEAKTKGRNRVAFSEH